MSYRLLTLAALLMLLPAAARAGCLYKPFDFHPEKNDGVVVDVIVDGGSSCTHNFGEGPGYAFTGLRVEREPENGKLIKTGANRFLYTPDKGFIGKDAYILKICASKGARRGCSTVAFVSQVK
ncbi:hypothetical protein GCM10007874_71810 [Labrys miyagiensis]|uniref:Uncharacterized protein n=1 Tax=Labrys miyagiensis TaxID=346912 RepID=A0ABQ6CYP0_9HYPH|nr:hypothetical protein [Labrys miyagiensis]GLS24160.1 hypothetical protein GCM10007874_71810 [Labrys miyagiensis]